MTTDHKQLFDIQYRNELDMYHLLFSPGEGTFLIGDYPTMADAIDARGVYESVYLRAKADGIELALVSPETAREELERYR